MESSGVQVMKMPLNRWLVSFGRRALTNAVLGGVIGTAVGLLFDYEWRSAFQWTDWATVNTRLEVPLQLTRSGMLAGLALSGPLRWHADLIARPT
jgi:hypothetical protein